MRQRLHRSLEQRHALLRRHCAAWAAYGLLCYGGCGGEEPSSSPGPVSTTAGTGSAANSSSGKAGSAGGGIATSKPTSIPNPAPQAGAAAGAAQSGAAAPSAAGASGSPIAGSGGTGGIAAPASAGAGAGTTGAAGSGVTANSMFKRSCKDFEPGPCSSFIPGGPYGAPEIELGPYGASLDFNVGKEFAYPIADGDADNDATCSALSNGQTSQVQQSVDYTLYSVYRPGQYKEGEKLPLIVWGDGTCAWPEAYGPLLRYVASHGFFIVAPNSRWVGDGSQMKKALDYIFAENDKPDSPYYQKIDTTKVGAMGHSQGSSGTAAVASDARVKAVILWNGGSSASKPFLAVSGEGDIANATPASMRRDVEGAAVPQAAFLFYHMILQMSDVPGHLTLVTQPHRVIEPTVAWWKYILNGDAEAKAFFVGADCKLCNRTPEFDFGQKGL